MNYGKENISMMIREIIAMKLKSELDELADKYDIPVEKVENMAIRLYVHDTSKVQWKSSNTKFIKLFEKEIKILFEKRVINFQELGFLTFLGVYFTNYEDNSLRNDDGSKCTQTDIVNKSGMGKSNVSKILKKLIEKKLIFERKHKEVINAKEYYISPYILYRGVKMDKKIRDKLNEIKNNIMEIWNNYYQNNQSTNNENRLELNDFDPENFITMLEESIVSECLHDTYETTECNVV